MIVHPLRRSLSACGMTHCDKNTTRQFPFMAVCHEYRRSIRRCVTVREMEMLWGKRRGCDTFGAVQQTDGAPHVAIF